MSELKKFDSGIFDVIVAFDSLSRGPASVFERRLPCLWHAHK